MQSRPTGTGFPPTISDQIPLIHVMAAGRGRRLKPFACCFLRGLKTLGFYNYHLFLMMQPLSSTSAAPGSNRYDQLKLVSNLLLRMRSILSTRELAFISKTFFSIRGQVGDEVDNSFSSERRISI